MTSSRREIDVKARGVDMLRMYEPSEIRVMMGLDARARLVRPARDIDIDVERVRSDV